MEKTEFVYDAIVVNVVDGDTIDVNIDLGFDVTFRTRLRLLGIDTPELNSKDVTIREDAQKARQFVIDKVFQQKVVLETFKKDKYGRYLANVYYNGTLLNEELLIEGLAKVY